ncbi:hypothetical protein ES706_00187 [subsurface metagenome]|nr:hypothetical protein [Hadesarchaea archaeon]
MGGKIRLRYEIARKTIREVFKGEKIGVWTNTIKGGVYRNVKSIIRKCCKGKTGHAARITASIYINLKKIEDTFILESGFDQVKLNENERIARTCFRGQKAHEFIRQGNRPPQSHDITILAEAMILKEEYNEISLYTYDKHFGFFVDEIKKIVGICVTFCGLQ